VPGGAQIGRHTQQIWVRQQKQALTGNDKPVVVGYHWLKHTLKTAKSINNHKNPSTSKNIHSDPSTSIKMYQHLKIHENPSTSIRTHQHPSKCINIHQHPFKSTKIHQHPFKSIKSINIHQNVSTSENP